MQVFPVISIDFASGSDTLVLPSSKVSWNLPLPPARCWINYIPGALRGVLHGVVYLKLHGQFKKKQCFPSSPVLSAIRIMKEKKKKEY